MEPNQSEIFYEIQKVCEIKRGSSAELYKMYSYTRKEHYCLKLFKPNCAEEYYRESKALKDLNHPNIIRKISERDKQILLEFCSNGDLFLYIDSKNSFPDGLIRYYLKQLVQTLQFALSRGYVHRDIKLENILVDQAYNLKLADWSFSQNNYKGQPLRKIMGTLQYMPPEMIESKPYTGTCTDVFSLGVVAFLMKLKMFPIAKSADPQDELYKFIVAKQYEEYWGIISQRAEGKKLDPEFKELIEGMICYNPEERLTLQQVENSAFMKGATFTAEESKAQMQLFAK